MRREATADHIRNVHERVHALAAALSAGLPDDDERTPRFSIDLHVDGMRTPVTLQGLSQHEHSLAIATALDTHQHPDRRLVLKCPHTVTADVIVFAAALRFEGCTRCVQAKAAKYDRRLARDNSCDVCGTEWPEITGRYVPFGRRLAVIHTGPCCDPLFAVGAA